MFAFINKYLDYMFSFVINDKVSLKFQLISLFTILTALTAGLTLAICYGMLYSLGNTTYENSSGIISDQSTQNTINLGKEIALAINQNILIIAQSVCQVSALYAKNLLSYSESGLDNGTLFDHELSYREYNFYGKCGFPNCPGDYGPLSGRSRFPSIPGFTNGSITHSSVYLFDSVTGQAARNDTAWDNLLGKYPAVNTTINGLAYQDFDFSSMYSKGPNTTVMFYLSAQVFTDQKQYVAVHRTFPGIMKNGSNYDPSTRSWFKDAPLDVFNLYGPYIETFTKQQVLTVSSRQQKTLSSGYSVTVVSAAVFLLESLATVVNSIDYSYGGFGAVLTYDTLQVLVWKEDQVYDAKNQQFKTLADFDPVLASYDVRQDSSIDYTDSDGEDWVVTSHKFLPTTSDTAYSLIMLVFSKKNRAQAPLLTMKRNIDSTTNRVVINTCIIVGITIGAVFLVTMLIVYYIARPLEKMRNVSAQIVHIIAEEEDHRDYTSVVREAFCNLSRTDEVGILMTDYYHIVGLLDEKNREKKETPKYPFNPFHMPHVDDYPHFTWSDFTSEMKAKKPKTAEDESGEAIKLAEVDVYTQVTAASGTDTNLDMTKIFSEKSGETYSSPPVYEQLKSNDIGEFLRICGKKCTCYLMMHLYMYMNMNY